MIEGPNTEAEAMDISEDVQEAQVEEQAEQAQQPQIPAYLRKFNADDYMEQTTGWSVRSYQSQAQALMEADAAKHDIEQAAHYFSQPQEKYVWDEELKEGIETQTALAQDLPIEGGVPSLTTARSLKEKSWDKHDIPGFNNWAFSDKIKDLVDFRQSQTQDARDEKPLGQLLYAQKLHNKGGKVLQQQGPQQQQVVNPNVDRSAPLTPSQLFSPQHDAQRIALRDALSDGRQHVLDQREAAEKAASERAKKIRGGF